MNAHFTTEFQHDMIVFLVSADSVGNFWDIIIAARCINYLDRYLDKVHLCHLLLLPLY